jgi:hypothetical protein
MKKFVLLCVMMMTCVFATENALANYLPVKKVRTTLRISEYRGTIGKNRVTFTVGTSTMGVEGYSYMYDNVGEWIELHPSGRSGRYQIFKEYVNGRCTGTFKIIWGANTITGTFRNYKGQTFKVYARSV